MIAHNLASTLTLFMKELCYYSKKGESTFAVNPNYNDIRLGVLEP